MAYSLWLASIVFVLLPLLYAAASLAPYHASRRSDLERVLRLADLRAGQTFYELGCGDGRVVMYAAKHSLANIVGLELAFPLFILCRLRAFFVGQKNVKILWRDATKYTLSDADVIFVYGMPDSLKLQLRDKFSRELKPGTLVMSYVFPIGGWSPVRADQPTKKDIPIYLYRT